MKTHLALLTITITLLLYLGSNSSLLGQSPCGACTGIGGIFITEIMYNPTGTDEGCEYIELYNGYSNEVELENWALSNSVSFTFPAGVTIASGEYILIADEGATGLASCGYTIPGTVQIFDYDFTLNNDLETIELSYDCSGTGVEVDYSTSVAYTEANGADGNGNAYYVNIATLAHTESLPSPGSGDCTGCTDAPYCCLDYTDVDMLCINATVSMTGPGTAAATTPYVSSDITVATVTDAGVVTGEAVGTATITYTDTNGCEATATVTVNALSTISDASVCAGSDVSMVGSGTAAAVTPYTSSDITVATVTDAGVVTGEAVGTATITYTDTNGCEATATVTVNALPTLSDGSTCVGSTVNMVGPGTAAATTPYVSSDITVATVTDAGVVTGEAVGTATITYTDTNGCEATATVTVNVLPTISGPSSVCEDAEITLVGSGTPTTTSPYASSDTGVATIDDSGVVTGESDGTTTITYTDVNGCVTTTVITVLESPSLFVSSPDICYDGTTMFDLSTIEPFGMTGGTWGDFVNTPLGSTMIIPVDRHGYIYNYTGANGCISTDDIVLDVESAPPATIDNIAVCMGTTSAALTLSSSNTDNANITHFKLDFDAAAETAGFVDMPAIAMTSGATITLPTKLSNRYL